MPNSRLDTRCGTGIVPRLVSLIGFPDETAAELAVELASHGCSAIIQKELTCPERNLAAVFVCGDQPEWRETVRQVRALDGSLFVVVATRLPDTTKWLDALEAGVSDYCCTPLDARQFNWLFAATAPSGITETTAAQGA